jgi:drug/metabolite transporter (DMT)-like permease
MAIFPYIFALMRDETSRVVPLFQVQPIFSYLLALVFLSEHLNTSQVAAGIIIMAGAALINLDLDNRFKLKKAVFGLMMLSTALFATEGFLFKFVAVDVGFWSAAFYQYLGTAFAGLALAIINKSYRTDFIEIMKSKGKKVLPISLLSESLNVLARVLFNYASLLAPLALVTLVNGFQPFFVIIIGVLLTLFWPRMGEESLLRKHLLQKALSVVIIFAGTYLLFK